MIWRLEKIQVLGSYYPVNKIKCHLNLQEKNTCHVVHHLFHLIIQFTIFFPVPLSFSLSFLDEFENENRCFKMYWIKEWPKIISLLGVHCGNLSSANPDTNLLSCFYLNPNPVKKSNKNLSAKHGNCKKKASFVTEYSYLTCWSVCVWNDLFG